MRPVDVLPLVFVAASTQQSVEETSQGISEHTNEALPEVVRLAFSGTGSGELPINLILDVRHSDEGCNNTTPVASFDCVLSGT